MKAQMGRERKTLCRQADNTVMRQSEHSHGTSTQALASSRWVSSGSARPVVKATTHLQKELRIVVCKQHPYVWPFYPARGRFHQATQLVPSAWGPALPGKGLRGPRGGAFIPHSDSRSSLKTLS